MLPGGGIGPCGPTICGAPFGTAPFGGATGKSLFCHFLLLNGAVPRKVGYLYLNPHFSHLPSLVKKPVAFHSAVMVSCSAGVLAWNPRLWQQRKKHDKKGKRKAKEMGRPRRARRPRARREKAKKDSMKPIMRKRPSQPKMIARITARRDGPLVWAVLASWLGEMGGWNLRRWTRRGRRRRSGRRRRCSSIHNHNCYSRQLDTSCGLRPRSYWCHWCWRSLSRMSRPRSRRRRGRCRRW